MLTGVLLGWGGWDAIRSFYKCSDDDGANDTTADNNIADNCSSNDSGADHLSRNRGRFVAKSTTIHMHAMRVTNKAMSNDACFRGA